MLFGLLGIVYFAKEYQSGDLATQRTILSNLSKFGVQNCSWVHTLSKTTTNTEVEGERVRTNFLTRMLGCSVMFILFALLQFVLKF